jgi:hypothetical protein
MRKRNQSPHLIEGVPAIARYLGKHPATIRRWIKSGFLPCGRAPDGTFIITPSLIDRAIIASHGQYQDERDNAV